MTATYSGEQFTWKKGNGHAGLSNLGLTEFPDKFIVRSHKTGDEYMFFRDDERMLEMEFYDGEATAYADLTKGTRIELWVGEQ